MIILDYFLSQFSMNSMQTSTPWFAVSMGLVGLIVGYGIATGVGMPPRAPAAPIVAGDTGGQLPDQPAAPETPATVDDDPVIGKADAPITLVEFSDFECPFCRRFWRDTYGQLKKDYVDTGKVKIVYRDFPLSFHPGAMPAAMAMECADDQSDALAWAVHDKVFEGQETITDGTTMDAAKIKQWVGTIPGLNKAEWTACFDSSKHTDEINKDMAAGSASGIDGTPGFWILGPDGQTQKISGAYPFATFQQAFDGMLQ